MRKLIYCLSFVLIASQGLTAQDTLIKINGDSLVGRLNFAKDGLGLEYVTMKVGRKKETVKLVQVRMIKTKKGELIRPVVFNGKYKFGKQVHLDYLSYYKVTGEGSSEMFTDDLLLKMDGTALSISGNIGFRNRVGKFLEDCYDVSYAVRQKKYNRGKLKELAVAYNACIQKNGLMSEDAIEQKAEQLRIERAKQEVISKPLEEKITDFATLMEHSDKISNKKDVTAMFNDVTGKLRRNEAIPTYLKTALQDALKPDQELAKLFSEILKGGGQ